MNPKTFPAACAALALLLTSAIAQVDDILATSDTFTPVITFATSHTDKLLRLPDEDYDIISVERLTAKVVANLTDFNFADLSEDTEISLAIGDTGFGFTTTIGELLPKDSSGIPVPYTPKFTGGTLVFWADRLDKWGDPVYDSNDEPVQVKIGTAAIAWNAKTLTITVRILDVDRAGVGSIVEGMGLLGDDQGEPAVGNVSFAYEPVPVSVTFGAAGGDRLAYARGGARTVSRNVYGDPIPLTTVSLSATADLVAPALTAELPLDDGGTGSIDFSGTVTDLPDSTLPGSGTANIVDVSAYVNDPDFAGGIPADEVSDPDKKGVRAFNFTFLVLDPGENTVVLVATDESGNTRSITRTVTSSQPAP